MYILLSPKGNFLSCSKLMYLFAALDSILCCTVTASVWAAYSSDEFYRSAHWLTFKQQIMDLYLESVFHVELWGLNLIITKGTLNPLVLWTPRGHFLHNAAALHPLHNMETSNVVFIWLFSIFSIVLSSDFPEGSSPVCLGALPNPDLWHHLLIWADRGAQLFRRGYNLHKDWCPSPHLILLLHLPALSSGPRWYQSKVSSLRQEDNQGSYIKWCCWGFNSIRTESEKFLSNIDQGRASMLISSDISVLQLMRCVPLMRSLFFHVPAPSTVRQLMSERANTSSPIFWDTVSTRLERALIMKVCNPPRVPDLTSEIAQLTFSICSYVWWWGTMTFTFAPLQYDPLARCKFSTQTVAQNRSQDQKCLSPEGATESILSISAPNGVFSLCCSLSLSPPSLSPPLSVFLSHQ